MKKKLLFNILIILCLSIIISPVLLASQYIPKPGDATTQPTDQTDKIKKVGGSIWGIVAAIGASVAAVILVWLAIKYITAAPDEKASIKKSAVNYIIGCMVLFAASGILALIASFATDLSSTLE